jgi:cytochrome oxidase Cu insertion factor (SCO1/SenC/PrrC family)
MRSSRRAGKKRKRGSGRTIGIAVLLVVAAVLAHLALQPAPPQPRPVPSTSATEASDFSLKDVRGNEFRLSGFRGRVVVLEFMSTTCPHCANEMPQLVAVWKRFGSLIVMISINVNQGDTDETLSAYASGYGAPWVWARDTANVASAYNATGIPTIVIIDPEGRIAYVNVGETPEAKLTQQIQTAQQ